MLYFRNHFAILTFLIISACSTPRETLKPAQQDGGPRPGSIDVSKIADAVPRDEPVSKYGNPESYVVNGRRYYVMNSNRDFVERGVASWYGEKFHGRRTSSGEIYDMYAMTAAHKSLPLPTYVEVKNIQNGKRIVVKVNDRGPFHDNRIIDLSYTAAAKLDILAKGTGLVEIRSIDPARYANERIVEAPVAVTGYNNPGFYIQVGAFTQRENAENMKTRLSVLDDRLVSVSSALVNGAQIYRVRIGPITDVSDADRIVSTLTDYGVNEHQLILD